VPPTDEEELGVEGFCGRRQQFHFRSFGSVDWKKLEWEAEVEPVWMGFLDNDYGESFAFGDAVGLHWVVVVAAAVSCCCQTLVLMLVLEEVEREEERTSCGESGYEYSNA
jgi:hypothetical protein